MQQTSQLVAHVDHHDLFASTSQVSDLILDSLGHTRVNGATQATVGGHADDQMFAGFVLRSLNLSLLVQRWESRRQLLATG